MAFELPLFDVAFKANADLSSLQYHIVKLDTANDVRIGTCSATTDTPVGILQNKPGSLQAAQVRVFGISKVVASAAMGPGSMVATAANAKAANIATGIAGTYSLGLSLDTVANAGEVASILLTHAGRGA